jgi:uncharacterized Zn finger protein (UPF0148 family)
MILICKRCGFKKKTNRYEISCPKCGAGLYCENAIKRNPEKDVQKTIKNHAKQELKNIKRRAKK